MYIIIAIIVVAVIVWRLFKKPEQHITKHYASFDDWAGGNKTND